jgi:hypothetical protein|tara:strand:- start:1783 stop:2223 length:441 start_codon:yes stop_codon:yes gene_type:complete
MAIQVSGTTVIDDSRNLVNVTGLKTINSTSILGSGNIVAGSSTSADAVGTYTWGRPPDGTNYTAGTTATGILAISLTRYGTVAANAGVYWSWWAQSTQGGWVNSNNTRTAMSGTWRSMGLAGGTAPNYGASAQYTFGYPGLWVRIS